MPAIDCSMRRKLVTIVCAYVAAYLRLMREEEEGLVARLKAGVSPASDCLSSSKVVGSCGIVPGGAFLTWCTIERSLAFGQVGDVLPCPGRMEP